MAHQHNETNGRFIPSSYYTCTAFQKCNKVDFKNKIQSLLLSKRIQVHWCNTSYLQYQRCIGTTSSNILCAFGWFLSCYCSTQKLRSWKTQIPCGAHIGWLVCIGHERIRLSQWTFKYRYFKFHFMCGDIGTIHIDNWVSRQPSYRVAAFYRPQNRGGVAGCGGPAHADMPVGAPPLSHAPLLLVNNFLCCFSHLHVGFKD